MAEKLLPSPKLLRQLIRYEPETGEMFWLFRKTRSPHTSSWNSRFAGKRAITAVGATGYISGQVNGRSYLAHRLAFALHYGVWPAGHIDHINGDRSDNRICNLRDVSRSENQRNKKLHSNNSSGTSGVHWSKSARKWCAQITTHKGRLHLGLFNNLGSAVAARKSAEMLHGFHENHGRL